MKLLDKSAVSVHTDKHNENVESFVDAAEDRDRTAEAVAQLQIRYE